MAKGYGEPVSAKVAAQIEARKLIIGKKTGKTNEDLIYANAKTGWIKMSSSVNTLTKEQSAQLAQQKGRKEINGSNILAGYNILMGGVLRPDRGLRQGIDYAPTDATTGAYSNYAYQNRAASTGIRPMPGITSMNVKSKNTYGTLREAEVKFVCWTLEDFEIMEELYLRPGFSILLEWGHSMYVDNDGKLYTEIESIGNRFFRNGIGMTQLLEDIKSLREKSSYNYEGMIGYVKNFSWNYNSTGGYECSVSIISQGEILESIKLTFDPQLRLALGDLESSTSEKGIEQRKSIYHYVITRMQEIVTPAFTKEHLKEVAPTLAEKLQDFRGYYQKITVNDSVIPFWDTNQDLYYIPLRTFFDIFNTSISLVDASKGKDSKDRTLAKFNIDYNLSSNFLTSPEHFSIDPLVCVLPAAPEADAGGLSMLSLEAKLAYRQATLDKEIAKVTAQLGPAGAAATIKLLNDSFWNELEAIKQTAKSAVNKGFDVVNKAIFGSKMGFVECVHSHNGYQPGGTNEDVLNILVPTTYLKAKLDEALDKDGKIDKSMHDIVESVLEGVNTALGGINDLGLAFDTDLDTWFLLDRNRTPTIAEAQKFPQFTLAGIDSVFTEVGISSKITNEMGSQISIAAQGSTQNYSDNVDNILKWNPNIIDRIRVTKDTSEEPKEGLSSAQEDREARAEGWRQAVWEYFTDFNTAQLAEGGTPTNLKTMHAEWTVENVVRKNKILSGEPAPGLIPVELSFKLDGIAGFIIGQAFKISPGILPSKYQDKFGYIVTGLEHSVGVANRWETSVTTQFFIVEPPSSEEVGAFSAANGSSALAVTNELAAQEAAGVHVPGQTSVTKGGSTRTIEQVSYKNGQMPSNRLVSISNATQYKGAISSDNGQVRLYSKAAPALDRLLAAATKGGVSLKINSAYRTVPDQKRTFEGNCSNSADSMQRCIPKPGEGPAAIPGTSNHGFGLAVDFANSSRKRLNTNMPEYAWLAFNAAQYGFKRIASEAWHWEYQI
jgi:LAS superfamily LD-carboxypeptidase LdcB